MKSDKELAKIIIENVGGIENVIRFTHCLTRLRFELKDETKAKTEILKTTDGIMTVINSGGEYQVVIGKRLMEVYAAICENENVAADMTALKNAYKGKIKIGNCNIVEKSNIETIKENYKHSEIEVIYAPVSGDVKKLSETGDDIFASGILGEGMAIIPKEGKVYAPCDGRIIKIFGRGYAIGIKSDEGAEILIHIGIGTAKSDGTGFHIKKEAGEIIKKGNLLLEFDIDKIKSEGCSIITPVIITNMENFNDIVIKYSEKTIHGEEIMVII